MRIRVFKLLALLFFVLLTVLWPLGAQEQSSDPEQLRSEEAEDYFQKWLTEDVVYIINKEEREVFATLSTDEEKEQFIEQFWFRRDPDPRSAVNEFKEEHYRRIAYANERFASGAPGWKTDRGRIYIIHGPPDEIEPHPSGGVYDRPLWEGGGSTVTFPFEVWRYRYIAGVGDDIILEFVDPAYSGEYRLALDPDEKDAFAKVPGLGLTLDEMEGLFTKADRGSPQDVRYSLRRDQPFDRYYRYTSVQRPQQVRYQDLKEIVDVNITYEELPFRVQVDQFRLDDERVLVPLTLEVENRDLSLVQENGKYVAKVAVYGLVTSLTNRVITEFEDDLVNSFSEEGVTGQPNSRSVYQKVLVLERKLRYKADIVMKDLNSGKTSVIRTALVPRDFRGEKLSASSLIMSDHIRPLDESPSADQMFVLGDVWIRPSLKKVFPPGQPVGVYFQLYNVGFDQADGKPNLSIQYGLLHEGVPLARVEDTSAQSVYYSSSARVVLIRTFPTADLPPGRYQIQIGVQDRITNETVQLVENFEVRS